jgi:lipoprotein-anchoring transpeptidase ErfK/SrfK
MRKMWVGAAALFAMAGLVAGDLDASTSNVKTNFAVVDEKPAPKKKKIVKVIKIEPKKPIRRGYRRMSTRCDGFFECLFDTRRATGSSFRSMRFGRSTRSTVAFSEANYAPGSIIIRTPERALYYVLPGGKALRYKVGVGKEGFQWSGNSKIGMKREWPDWRPPATMIAREAAKGNIIPEYMEGGPNNPLGARAMYISGTLFRIHGTNNAASIGGAVSSGCIRMMNPDVIDLYDRVAVGSRVYVYQ